MTGATLEEGAAGSVTVNDDGSLSFDPGDGYQELGVGESTTVDITYTISDGQGGTDTATATVTIEGTNDGPVANADTLSGTEDTAITFSASDLLGNDTDVDGDTLSIASFDQPDGGTITLNDDGSYTFTPDADFNGETTFTYTVEDPSGAQSQATVTIDVDGVNDGPVANADTLSGTEDTAITFSASDLLGNDTDVDGDTLSIASFDQPDGGTITLNDDGSYTFTPDADFNGETTFTYTVEDPSGAQSQATVTIDVDGVNDGPVAADDVATASEDGGAVQIDVLANDTDLDGDSLTVTGATLEEGAAGSVTVNDDGSLSFDPGDGYQELGVGESTTVDITYTISDGQGGTDTATATVTIEGTNDGPVANADTLSGTEDTAITFSASDLLGNDTDVDGDTLSIASFDQPDGGTITLNDDGSYTFTPDADFNGETTFTYTVEDPSGAQSQATVTIDVDGVNDGPVAADDVATASEDGGAVQIDVLANDTDLDGDSLTVTGATLEEGAAGSVTVNDDGSLSFDPGDGYQELGVGESTTVDITYTISDGQGGTDTATATVTIEGTNDGPVANADTLSGTEDTAITFSASDLLGNDTDVDGDTLSIASFDQPDGGTITLNDDGSYTFTPDADFNGETTFTYTVEDPSGAQSQATVTIDVDGVNDGPVAADDVATASEDGGAVQIDVLANDTDLDGDSLTVTGATLEEGAAGSVTVNDDGSLSFDPGDGYQELGVGESTTVDITYTISDGQGGTDTATATVTIEGTNDGPVANADTLSGTEDTAITFSASDLLGNDTDVDGDTLSIASFDQPDGGTITLNDDGSYTFTPDADFNGETTFTYTVEDPSGAQSQATVTIDVDGVNDGPVAADDVATASEDGGAVQIDVLANDTDLDGDSLTVTGATLEEGAAGSVTVNDDGSLSFDPGDGYQELGVGESTTVDITYTISDGQGGTDTATATVTIEGTNDGPVANADTLSGTEDTAITFSASDLLGNDTDVDGDTLSIASFDQPDGGTITLNDDGSYTFTPDADFNGETTFTYTVEDPSGAQSQATVTIDVDGVNDGPVAADDVATASEDGGAVQIDVLANDTDLDGDSLTVTGATLEEGAAGSVTVNDDGSLSFDPGDGYQELGVGESTTVDITYTISDGQGGTDTATATVTIEGTNDGPVANADTLSGTEDTAITFSASDLLGNDTDVDGDTLSIASFDQPDGGTITLNDDGSYTFTPDADFNGETTFTYTVEDPSGAQSQATVTIDVSADADQAVITTQDATGNEDSAVSLDIDVSSVDDVSSITITDVPAGAALSAGTDNGDGTWTLEEGDLENLTVTPPANSNEDFTLGISVTTADGNDTETVTGTIDVDVVGVADAPELTAELGEPTVTTVGGTETDVSITSSNFDATDSGFTVTARKIDSEGNLTEASADNVSDGSSGMGVNGNASGPSGQLGYDQETGQSEELIIDFDNGVSEVSFDFAKAFADEGGSGANEQGHYEIYRDGVKVGEGSFDAGDSGNTGSVTVSADDGGTFDQIVFTADDSYSDGNLGNGDGSDYLITSVDFTVVEGGETTVEYPLDISSNLVDTDGSESLSITVDDLPSGAVLSAGTQNDDGSWTLEANDLDGLTVTLSGEDAGDAFDFSVSATASESDGDTATVSQQLNAPGANTDQSVEGSEVSAVDAAGSEDTAIALDIDVTQLDTDGSESVSITISGVPSGATLSAGTENDDGTWTLDAGDLEGLSITPAENSNANFTLDVSVTTTETSTGESSTVNTSLDVDVTGVADAPTLEVSAASGDEDTAIALDISSALVDTDGSETLSVTVSDIPDGAILADADGNEITVTDGSADVSPSDLSGLTITPADNFNGSFDLTVTSTSSEEGGDAATVTSTLTVDVDAVNDGPVANADTLSGTEDTAITFSASDLLGNDTDVDGDTLSIASFDQPDGGTITLNDDGSYTFTPDADFNGETTFTYTVEDPSGAQSQATVTIDVDGVNDGPVAADDVATASEDGGAVQIDVLANDTDLDGDSLTVTGATLEEGAAGSVTVNDDGSLSFDPGDGYQELGVGESTTVDITYTISDGQGGTDTATATVTIEGTNDGPVANADTLSGTEDTAITFSASDLLGNDTDVDGDTLSIASFDQPDGGTITLNDDGSYTFTPDADFNGETTFTYTVEDPSGAQSQATVTIDVSADADQAVITTQDATGNEDSAVSLDIDVSSVDDVSSITITDVPAGAALSAGTDNGDGTWTLEEGDLENLTVTPPANSNEDFTLGISVTTADGNDTETVTGTIDVDVVGVADDPTLTVSVSEGTIVDVGDGSSATTTVFSSDFGNHSGDSFVSNVDGWSTNSEAIEVWNSTSGHTGDGSFIELNDDAIDSFDDATSIDRDFDTVEGATYTLTFEYSPRAGYDADTNEFQVKVDGEVVETISADGSNNSDNEWTSHTVTFVGTGEPMNLEFLATGDAQDYGRGMRLDNIELEQTVTEDAEQGVEYDLDISSALTDTDGSESLSITVDDLPSGATLSAGTENEDGSWTLSADDLAGLTITVSGDDMDQSFDLSVSATATEADGDTATVSTTVTAGGVVLDDTAEGVTIDTVDVSGNEDTAISLDIDLTQLDTDGSESITSITITDVPDGAILSAGTDNNDGTWTVDQNDLQNLTVTPPGDSNADFTLGVSVVTTDTSGATTTNTATLDVDVTGVADAPTLSASATYTSSESSETSVGVPSNVSSAAVSGTTVVVAGVPSGASLSAGTDNGDGTWTLDDSELSDLTITPADGSTESIDLSFSVEGSGTGTTLFTDNFDNGVSGWGDEVGAEDGTMYIGWEAEDETATRSFDFGDEHAGQTVEITFSTEAWSGWDESGDYQDVMRVEANGSEVYTSSEGDATTHTMTVTLDGEGKLDLGIQADTTYHEEGFWLDNFQIAGGDDFTSELATGSVTVEPDAAGDTYDLDVTSELTDGDGSETLSITIDDLPAGTVLSAGTQNDDGSWTLEAGDLEGLTATVPSGTDDFDFSVEATATENDGDTNTVSVTVSVDAPEVDVTAEAPTLSVEVGNPVTEAGEPPQPVAYWNMDETSGSSFNDQIGDNDGHKEYGSGSGDGNFDMNDVTNLQGSGSGSGAGDHQDVTADLGTATELDDNKEQFIEVDHSSELKPDSGSLTLWFNSDESNDGTLASSDSSNYDDGGHFNLSINSSGELELRMQDEDSSHTISGGDVNSGEWNQVTVTWGDGGMKIFQNGELVASDESYTGGLQGNENPWTFGAGQSRSGDNSSSGADDFFDGHLDDIAIFNEPLSADQVQELYELGVEDFMDEGTGSAGDSVYPVTITAGLTDTDGSETLSIVVADLPDGVSLSAGTENGDGTWTLSSDDLDGLTMTVPSGTAAFDLDVTATSTEENGDTASVTVSADIGSIDGITIEDPGVYDHEGNSSANNIDGGGGDDVISGGDGNDTIDGDQHWYKSEDGDDTIFGGAGDDTITGGGGEDVIDGGADDDKIYGDHSWNESGGGNDTIDGGAGNDTIYGGAGSDVIDGDDGNDVMYGDLSYDTSQDGDDTMYGGAGDDTLYAGDGNDTLDGGTGDDDAYGGDGNDLFIFGAGDGADYFDGGNGWSDTVQLDGVDGGPGGESGWTLQLDDGATYTAGEDGIDFGGEVSGKIELADGSELTFEGVEKLEW